MLNGLRLDRACPKWVSEAKSAHYTGQVLTVCVLQVFRWSQTCPAIYPGTQAVIALLWQSSSHFPSGLAEDQ